MKNYDDSEGWDHKAEVIHVYPTNDLKEHITNGSKECWCEPCRERESGGVIVIHNSLDRREDYEESVH